MKSVREGKKFRGTLGELVLMTRRARWRDKTLITLKSGRKVSEQISEDLVNDVNRE